MIDTGLDKGLDLMEHHWLVAELDQRLGTFQRQRAQSGAKPTDKDNGLHFLRFSKESNVTAQLNGNCVKSMISLII